MAEGARQHLLCTKCNWRFQRSHVPNLCPNCGKQGTIEIDHMRGAEDILHEIEEMESQFEQRR